MIQNPVDVKFIVQKTRFALCSMFSTLSLRVWLLKPFSPNPEENCWGEEGQSEGVEKRHTSSVRSAPLCYCEKTVAGGDPAGFASQFGAEEERWLAVTSGFVLVGPSSWRTQTSFKVSLRSCDLSTLKAREGLSCWAERKKKLLTTAVTHFFFFLFVFTRPRLRKHAESSAMVR